MRRFALMLGLGGLVAGAWWLMSTAPRTRRAPPASTASTTPRSSTPARAPTTTRAPRRAPRTSPPVTPGISAEAPPIMQTAAEACVGVEPLEDVELMLPTHVPGIPGVHPAYALCEKGELISLSFRKGDDIWIHWDVRDGKVDLVVSDFGDDALPTRTRHWIDGRLVEEVFGRFNADGGRDVTLYREGVKAKRLQTRKRSATASTAQTVEDWLDTTQYDLDTRSAERARLLDYDAYAVEEYFEEDGSLDFRLEHLSEDLGDGWFLEQMRSDKQADGVYDAVILTKRHVDGRSSMAMLFDKDEDGRFEQLRWRSGDALNTEFMAVDWPADTADIARLRGYLPEPTR